jgi:hypothetical protein
MHENPDSYDLEELYQFFRTRISGVSYQLSADSPKFNSESEKSLKFAGNFKKRVLFYCLEDFSKKERIYLKVVGRGYNNVLSMALESC